MRLAMASNERSSPTTWTRARRRVSVPGGILLERMLRRVLVRAAVLARGCLLPTDPVQVVTETSVTTHHLHQSVGDGVMPPIHPIVEDWADGPHDPVADRWIFQSGLPQIQLTVAEVRPHGLDRLLVEPHPPAAEIRPPSIHDGVGFRDQVPWCGPGQYTRRLIRDGAVRPRRPRGDNLLRRSQAEEIFPLSRASSHTGAP